MDGTDQDEGWCDVGDVVYTAMTVVMFAVIYLGGLFTAAYLLASREINQMNPNNYRLKAPFSTGSDRQFDQYDQVRIKRDRQKSINESLALAVFWPVWTPVWLVVRTVKRVGTGLTRLGGRTVVDPLRHSLDAHVGPSPVELKIENERLKTERDRQRKELERLEKIEAERDDIAEALAQEELRRRASTA